jgi:hypothetical protein
LIAIAISSHPKNPGSTAYEIRLGRRAIAAIQLIVSAFPSFLRAMS